MNNPVKHGLVVNADEYKWCSSAWFAQNATPAHRKVVANFKSDAVKLVDDF